MRPVADGVWVVEAGPQRIGPFAVPIRMTVLRLADGGLWLHSPVPRSDALAAALAGLGPVRHLVAPSTAHWTHIPGWQAAEPAARLWAVPGLAARAGRQGVALRLHAELGADPPPDWAAEMDHAVLAGPGFVEVAFHHRASSTAILTDTVQNMPPESLGWPTRLLARLAGSAAPDGRAPIYLRALLRAPAHRAANRDAVRRILAWQPRRAIFAHGAWFEQDATARLEPAFAWALRP